jgi:hypothetical protein
MQQRLRLDLPTLEDPIIRDLLHESDMFARSFTGMGGFGLLSPFDFINILALIFELASHLCVLVSLTGAVHFGALLLSIFSAVLPLLMRWSGFAQSYPATSFTPQEVRAAERLEKLRNLAYNDDYRPEIILFGLGPWILRSWAKARKVALLSEQPLINMRLSHFLLSHVNFADLLFALQNVRIPVFPISHCHLR